MRARWAAVVLVFGLSVTAACSSGDDDAADPTAAPAAPTAAAPTTVTTAVTTAVAGDTGSSSNPTDPTDPTDPTTPETDAGGPVDGVTGHILTLEDGPGTPTLLDPSTGDTEVLDIGREVFSQVVLPIGDDVLLAGRDDDNLWLLRSSGEGADLVDLGVAAGEGLEERPDIFLTGRPAGARVVLNGDDGPVVVDAAAGEAARAADDAFAFLSGDGNWIEMVGAIAPVSDPDAEIRVPEDAIYLTGPDGMVAYTDGPRVRIGSLDDPEPFAHGEAVGRIDAVRLAWSGDTLVVADADGDLSTVSDGRLRPLETSTPLGQQPAPLGLGSDTHVGVLGSVDGDSAFWVVDVSTGEATEILGDPAGASDRWQLFDTANEQTGAHDPGFAAVALESGEVFDVPVPANGEWQVEDIRGDTALFFTGCGERGLAVDLPTGDVTEIPALCTGQLSPDGQALAWSSGADDADPNELLVAPLDAVDDPVRYEEIGFPIAWI